jgi:potassium intermediate/small conductance calcium-activated channel subfamily N protein 2
MGSTALLVYSTISRYQARIQWMKSRGIIGSRDKFLEIDDNFYMMVEIIIYCIIPLPFTSNIRITFYNVS